MPSYFILAFTTITLQATAQPVKKPPDIEVIETKDVVYDTAGNQFLIPGWSFKAKIWYRDSLAIEEISTLKIITDAYKNTTEKTVIDHYRFNDLRSGVIYEYKNFADTARIIKQYIYSDTMKLSGGWGFISERHIKSRKDPESLSDTLIGEIYYKRVRVLQGTDIDPFFIDCYFRCDKKETVFNYDPRLSKMIGCPLVKLYNYSPFKKETPSSSEINFISNTLSDKELKVFDAWERNIRENAVNK